MRLFCLISTSALIFCLISPKVSGTGSAADEFDSTNEISRRYENTDNQLSSSGGVMASVGNFFSTVKSFFVCSLKDIDIKFRHHSHPKMELHFRPDRKTFTMGPPDDNQTEFTVINYEMFTENLTSLKEAKLKRNGKFKFVFHGFSKNASDYFPSDIIGAYRSMLYIEEFYKRFPNDQLCEAGYNTAEPVIWKRVVWRKCKKNEKSDIAKPTLDMNIISVEWNAAGPNFDIVDYLKCRRCLEKISMVTARFIESLAANGYIKSLDDVHLIGFSFGAQIAGRVAELLQSSRVPGGSVARITGLDPAFPLFMFRSLDKSDAKFVDVIHTSDFVGKVKTIGHVDIYSNSKLLDYGWSDDCRNQSRLIDRASCAHNKAHELFAFSILHPKYPIGYKCDFTWDFGVKLHQDTPPIRIGEYIDPGTEGVYCFCRNMLPPNLKTILNTYVEGERLNFGYSKLPKWEKLFLNWDPILTDEC